MKTTWCFATPARAHILAFTPVINLLIPSFGQTGDVYLTAGDGRRLPIDRANVRARRHVFKEKTRERTYLVGVRRDKKDPRKSVC